MSFKKGLFFSPALSIASLCVCSIFIFMLNSIAKQIPMFIKYNVRIGNGLKKGQHKFVSCRIITANSKFKIYRRIPKFNNQVY